MLATLTDVPPQNVLTVPSIDILRCRLHSLMYRRRMPSKFLGANLPFTIRRDWPSSDPSVPNSARRKAMTWSGGRCMLGGRERGREGEGIAEGFKKANK